MTTPKAKLYPLAGLAAILTDGDEKKLVMYLERATEDLDAPFEDGMQDVTHPELVALRKYARHDGNVRLVERINDVLRRGLPSESIRDYWLRPAPGKDEVTPR